MMHTMQQSRMSCALVLIAGMAFATGCDDGSTSPSASYTLALSAPALTIAQGASAPTTVNLTRADFSGAVTLTFGGAPAGVTGSFDQNPASGASSELTVAVGASVAPGVYPITIRGAASGLSDRTDTLTLTVSAAPDYSLSLTPAALTIVQGAQDSSTVTLTRTNFTGPVTLSLGGASAGITGVFAPDAPSGTSSTLTVSVGAAVTPGVYDLTVDGVGAPGNHSTPLTLTVTAAAADYSLSLAPAVFTIAPGANAQTTVTISRTNFTGAVTLSLEGAPAGVTGVFSPAAPTGTSSTLTVTVDASVTPGDYNLTVDGTGAPGSRSTPLTLTVSTAADYSLSLNPTALTIEQGANAPTVVTLTRSNFAGAVTLSLGGAPAGVTGVFAPAAPTGSSSTLTVTVGAAVAPGVYNLTVDGTGSPGDRSTPLTLTVTATPNYSLSLTPAAVSIGQSANAPATVTITRTNFTGAVTLGLGGAPAGVTGAFNPAAPTGTSSTLTVTVGAAVAPGVYNLTVDGTGTPGNRSTPLTLTVTAAADYSLSLNPAALTIAQGANGPSAVTISRTNFIDAVTLSLGGAPAGVSGAFNPTAPTGTSSTLTVTVGGSVTPGVYNLTVDGTGTPGSRSTPLTLTVTSSGGGGGTTWDFAACPAADRPVWLAVQDDSGPWTVITPVGDAYSFTITGTRGGITYVLSDGGFSDVLVQYYAKAEIGSTVFCQTPSVGKTVNGVANIFDPTDTSQRTADIWLGGGETTVFQFAQGYVDFQIDGVASGSQNLVGAQTTGGNLGYRAIIRRGLNIPDNGSLGDTLDFAGGEAFALDTATFTLSGPFGNESSRRTMTYHMDGCVAAPLYDRPLGGSTSFLVAGVPAAQQVAGDLHGFSVSTSGPNGGIRTTTQYFHTFGPRSITLPAVFPTPTITPLGGPYKRLQAVYTLPSDYQQSTFFSYYGQGAGTEGSARINATFAYLGGASVTLALPDYTGLPGWNDSWAPGSGGPDEWSAGGVGGTATPGSCSENAQFNSGSVFGF